MSNFSKLPKSNLNRDLFALSLDPVSDLSLQAQLLDALRQIVLSSSDHAGLRLPASRILAAELSVSRTTVQATYDQLISEGYLVGRQGSGTFVAHEITHLSQPRDSIRPEAPPVLPWAPFQTGLPDQSLVPHQQWARHLERAWRRPEQALLARPDPQGWYPLRAAIADHLAAWRQLSCDPDQVVITSGASESFEIIFRGLLAAQTHVAVEDPCWPKMHEVLNTTGMKAQSVRIDAEGMDAAAIPPQARVTIVTPSRHFPTGRSLPLARRLALLEWAARVGGLIVEDDYDSEFRYRGHPLPSFAGLDGLEHTIYLGSFSKLLSHGVRIGYMVVPMSARDKVRSFLHRVGSRASLTPQPALTGFMQSGEFAVHLRRMRRVYGKRQSHLIAALAPVSDLLEVHPDPAGMHLCVPLRPALAAQTTDQQVSARAAEAGLKVGALSTHSVLPDKPQALLLGYAAFDENTLSAASERFIEILRGFDITPDKSTETARQSDLHHRHGPRES